MISMPCCPSKPQAILPALFVYIATHVDVPTLPLPYPTWVWDLRIRDVDRRGLKLCVYPRRLVNFEVPQSPRREEGQAEDEPAALVLVEDVDVRIRCWWGSICLLTRLLIALRTVIFIGTVDEGDVLICHREGDGSPVYASCSVFQSTEDVISIGTQSVSGWIRQASRRAIVAA